MQCSNPIHLYQYQDRLEYPDGLKVPCNKCANCRISYRREWTLRCLHEMDYHEENVFLTLTYDQEHTPQNKSLEREEYIKFLKRLRKRMDKDGRKIKHFSCGDYGEPATLKQRGPFHYWTEGERPHYHSIIFGLGLTPEDKKAVMAAWDKCDWDNREIREGSFGCVQRQSIQYVAKYINNKLSGELADEEYTAKNRQPVFGTFTPGLGKQHVLDNADMYWENQFTKLNGTKITLPRYYVNKLREKYAKENEGEFFDFSKAKEHVTEKQKALIHSICGHRMSFVEAEINMETNEQTDKILQQMDRQREINAISKIELKEKRKSI